MTTISVDLTIYSRAVLAQAIAAYHALADISLCGLDGNMAQLEVTNHSQHSETQVVDEFLNYLIVLTVKSATAL